MLTPKPHLDAARSTCGAQLYSQAEKKKHRSTFTMTVDPSNWYEDIPVADFRDINEKSGSPVPSELPPSEPVGGVQIQAGPILRLAGTLENGSNNYRGSILLVVKGLSETTQIPRVTFNIGPSTLAPHENPQIGNGEFPGVNFHSEKNFHFFRYAIDLSLAAHEQTVRYSINGTSKSQYQFFIPAESQSMNVVSFSCNGFSLGTDTSGFKSSLWFDVLNKHQKQHYHVMLGGGDQIYADSIKKHSKSLQKWLNQSSHQKKREMKATAEDIEDFENYYLNHYLAWFGKGYWVGTNGKTLQSLFPTAMSMIPSVNIYDDHDIIDGFGSYDDRTMGQHFFLTVGNVAYKYYMLFQHQMSPEEKSHTSDPSWILSDKPGPFIHQLNHSVYLRLGKEISMVGVDCRTERKFDQVVANASYKKIFARLEQEIQAAPEVKHLLVMLGVPILYPRLVWLEKLLTSSLLKPVRKLAERGVINKGLVNEFDGGVEVLDDLNDHWCSKNHKRERNYLVRELIEFGAKHGVRITLLSGDVHLCCISRVKSRSHHLPGAHILTGTEKAKQENFNIVERPEEDPRLIFNVISSAITNAPPPDAMASLLNKRLGIHHFNTHTDEDVVPLFTKDPDGSSRDNHQFLNKRNWADLVVATQSTVKAQIGEKRFPGPVGTQIEGQVDNRHTKYPVLADSLVTTLHVEDDPCDFDCKTAGYEVLIPPLTQKYKLDRVPIKHLT